MATTKFKNPVTGLIHVTGEHDVGKTVFALSCGAQPSRIAFFDDDIKGRNTVNQLKSQGFDFGLYVDLIEELSGKKEVEVNTRAMSLIESIQPGKFDCIVFDTWTKIGASFFYVVKKNPDRYKEFYAPNGQIKNGEIAKAGTVLEAKAIDDLLKKAPMVVLITHLRDEYAGNKPTGRKVPDAKKTLDEKSNFRVWLRHNPDGAAPIGLILKRPVKMAVTSKGIVPVNVLPRKIKPFTWERVINFWENPIGDRPLTDDEKPDAYELGILDGILTEDQKNILRLAVLDAEKEQAELRMESSLSSMATTQSIDLSDDEKAMSIPSLARALSDRIGRKVSIIEAKKLLEESNK